MRRLGRRLLLVFLIFTPSVLPALSDFTGQVVGIIDGDTIDVLHNGQAGGRRTDPEKPERIRLNGTDCPENGQPFGKDAKQFTSSLVFGKKVTLHIYGKDQSGYTLADVLLPDGTNVNYALVKSGRCWWSPQDAPDNVTFAELQRRARKSGLGLWANPEAVPPWEWREGGRVKRPLPGGPGESKE
ncbi:MAG TPA: thermonuclease family protein [Nitrospira sp.]|nr:thermonuclease family protein [Nitrospira sp.]